MSGGGGGGGGGGGIGGDPPSDCASLIFRTHLNSPDPEVVAGLADRQVLEVAASGPTGPVLARTADGRTAGSITAGQMLRLLECIEGGTDYVAVVLSVAGGRVQVEVRPEGT